MLLASFVVGVATGMPLLTIVETIQKGFGYLIDYIGLVIILGVALEKSGAPLRLAAAVLNGIGKKRPALGISLIGALVGIPVFCDSGFIILSVLNNALANNFDMHLKDAYRSYTVMTILQGLTAIVIVLLLYFSLI